MYGGNLGNVLKDIIYHVDAIRNRDNNGESLEVKEATIEEASMSMLRLHVLYMT